MIDKKNLRKILQNPILLCGDDRHIKDFLYVFSDIAVCEKIDESNPDDVLNKQGSIIFCSSNRAPLEQFCVNHRLHYGDDYWWAEDFFCLLDFDLDFFLGERKMVVWGCGRDCDFFESHSVFFDGQHVYAYIANEGGDRRHGIQIYHPDEIEDWKKFYVIIATTKYLEEISADLQRRGLKEGKDFSSFHKFLHTDGISGECSEMMEKIYSAKPMSGPKCLDPFDDCNIAEGGYVSVCKCPPWMPGINIGSIVGCSCDELWYGIRAKLLRLSIINRTYVFCDMSLCREKRFTESTERFEDLEIQAVPRLVLSFSNICNLACRQCRRNHIVKNESFNEASIPTIIRHLRESDWINKTPILYVAGNGEVFFDASYKEILFSDADNKRKSVVIKSNGILFDEKIFEKLLKHYKEISVDISVDAATVGTYRKLRGEGYERLCENLKMLSRMKKEGKVKYFNTTFCVQIDNVNEMEEYVNWMEALGADCAQFQKLYPMDSMTDEEYRRYSCFDDRGTMKPELRAEMNKAYMKKSIVNASQLLI